MSSQGPDRFSPLKSPTLFQKKEKLAEEAEVLCFSHILSLPPSLHPRSESEEGAQYPSGPRSEVKVSLPGILSETCQARPGLGLLLMGPTREPAFEVIESFSLLVLLSFLVWFWGWSLENI